MAGTALQDGTRDRRDARRRIEREIARLEALVARVRWRRRGWRALRGGTGAGGTLLTLIKLKVAGSLGAKLAIAAVVGVGFAWPALALVAIVVLGVVVAILSLFSGEGGVSPTDFNCDCNCPDRRARLRRAKELIAARKAWLAAPTGPAPSLRRSPPGRLRPRPRGKRG